MLKKHNRRQFLRDSLSVTAGAATFGGLGGLAHLAGAQTDADQDRYYVFCYFGGGWDVLLSLDPRDPAIFTDEGISDHRIQPAYDLTQGSEAQIIRPATESNLEFGPFIGDLAEHWQRMAVVRGMSMETLAHGVGRRRFLTGKPPSGLNARGSSMGTWLAANTSGEQPIPQLSINVETYNQTNLPTEANALSVSSMNDLTTLLRIGDPQLDEPQLDGVRAILEAEGNCRRARHSPMMRDWDVIRERTRLVIESDLAGLFNLGAATDEMAELRGRYGITNANQNNPRVRCALAAQALMSGVSRCVSLSAAGGALDTHFNNWANDQGRFQQAGFDAIAALISHLSDTPYKDTESYWIDHTTIVGFSEFSRTPLLNNSGGRDHHITNSCFLAGGNIKGNTVIGASSDVGMTPQLVNVSTGEVDPGGEVIRPEHVLRSLYVDAGMTSDVADLRVDPIGPLMRG